jgi:hypothetical protein
VNCCASITAFLTFRPEITSFAPCVLQVIVNLGGMDKIISFDNVGTVSLFGVDVLNSVIYCFFKTLSCLNNFMKELVRF